MALQGVFNADFSKFTAACADAEASLKGFETGANTTAAALNKMADSVSGQKIVQQAYLATKAVEDVGGAAVLTEKELARMSAIASEGAEKLIKMGQTVPADMQRLADATKNTAEATGGWASALSTAQGYLAAFGIQASLGGVLSFTKSIFDSASAIHDMGERLGISAEAVQGFQYAAEQAGSSLDAVGSAITRMNKGLAEGDKNTVAALRQAGLEFDTIRNMKPEDAFLAITDAIAQIPDPMERSQVTLALFGKSAAELLPAITEGFRGTAAAASKMSNETIAALERAQDAWDTLGKDVTRVTGTMIADMIEGTRQATSSWGNFWQFMKDATAAGLGGATALANIQSRLIDTAVAFVGPIEDVKKGLHATKEETDAAEKAAEKYAGAWAELNSMGNDYAATVANINPKIAEQASYYLKAGASVATVAAAFPQLSQAQAQALAEMLKQHEATVKAIEKIEGDHSKAIETNFLGLSKAQNDAMQKEIEGKGRAATQLIALDEHLTDEYNKQTMSRAAYADAKVWESAQKQIDAFEKTGASAQQLSDFSAKIWEEAAIKASEIDWTSSQTIDNITNKAIDGVKKMAAAGASAIQSLQGGTKLPGSSYEQDFGQNYLVSPTGSKVPLGPGGNLPKNWFDLYSGKSNFPQFAGGVNNFSGGLAIVGERGPELVNLPGGSDVIPSGRGGGVTQIFNISHPLGTPEAIARAVAEAQVGLLRTQGVRLPYGT